MITIALDLATNVAKSAEIPSSYYGTTVYACQYLYSLESSIFMVLL